MIENTEKELKGYFDKKDLDLRKSKFSRFMDQKVTPDVLCFIADCIVNLSDNSEFKTKDIWKSDYFVNNTKAIFGKPSPKNEKASSEYDKFIIQPLRMLYYSGILESKQKGQGYIYSVKEPQLLEFISIRERNAYIFLYSYITKVLSDSGLLTYFETFRDKCKDKSIKKEDYEILKNRFIRFMRGHTPINQNVEIRRIFPKILNVYAVENFINGTEKGHLSKHTFNFPDLMYNRQNWRDVGKSKGLTRTESEEREKTLSQKKDFHIYLISKAKDRIRRKYNESEVKDSFSKGTASHIHHIFPIADFPQLSALLENLIKLTATQHLEKAHPKGKTQVVNRDYQCVCLLAKSESVEDSLNKGEFFYSKPQFIYVVNEGLSLSLDNSENFDSIRHEINKAYNQA